YAVFLQELVAACLVRVSAVSDRRAGAKRVEAFQGAGATIQVRPAEPVYVVVLRDCCPGLDWLDRGGRLLTVDAGRLYSTGDSRSAHPYPCTRDQPTGTSTDCGTV